jgi:hypothetical protein
MKMKRIVENHSEGFGFLRIYREDLESILVVLEELGKPVTIQADGFELDTAKELFGLRVERLRKLSISVSDPYVSLDYENNRIWLYIAKDDIQSRGVFEKLKLVIKKRQNRLQQFLLNPIVWGVSMAGVLILDWAAGKNLKIGLVAFLLIVGASLIIGVAYATFAIRAAPYGISRINISYKKELPSFWKRQKDNILSNLLFMMIGAALTIAIQKIFGM